ncbi:MAG: hypothetical protein HYZ39_19220 [Mycolicibacterium cosmeticum]|nr:hypothetical protein [Mycolicibacterium cosmeticum]
MNDQVKEDTLSAIAVVTAAVGQPGENKTLAAQVANEWVSEHPHDGATRLANGFVQLCIVLLAQIKYKTEASPEETLQMAAELVNDWTET